MLRSVRHFLNHLDVKLKPIVTCSRAFSRAWRWLHVLRILTGLLRCSSWFDRTRFPALDAGYMCFEFWLVDRVVHRDLLANVFPRLTLVTCATGPKFGSLRCLCLSLWLARAIRRRCGLVVRALDLKCSSLQLAGFVFSSLEFNSSTLWK